MRMAKDQGLPLNPMKISGVCGRLMCCLVYENEQYVAMKGKLPKSGQMVMIPPDGVIAKVIDSNVIKETVTVELETKATRGAVAAAATGFGPALDTEKPKAGRTGNTTQEACKVRKTERLE
jgi:cell fate regulator YaaT (PSP1 superfamily)